MTIYIVLMVALIFGCLFFIPQMQLCNSGVKGNRFTRDKELVVTIALLAVFVFIQSIRTTNVGGDLHDNYADNFYLIGRMSFDSIVAGDSGYEIGYSFLNKAVFIISHGNINVLLFIISFFFFLSFAIYVYHFSLSPYFALFIFFSVGSFTFSMNELRSTLALSLFLIALTKLSKGKNVRFLLLAIAAFFFHRISILFFVFWLLTKFKSIKLVFCFLLISVVIVILKFDYIGEMLYAIFPKYKGYFSIDNSGGGYVLFAFEVFILLFIIVFSTKFFVYIPQYLLKKQLPHRGNKKKTQKFNSNYLFLEMLLFAVLLQVITFKVHFFSRIVIYFFASSVSILIPNFLYKNKFKKNTKPLLFAIVLLFALYYFVTLPSNSSGTIPYSSILGG